MMKPILVFCSDLEYYYCKYKRSHYGDELFNEYLGASFLKIWELGVPDFALVEIHQEHIPTGLHADIQPFYFGAPCFGSKYSRSYSEVDLISHQLSDSQKRAFKRRNEILEETSIFSPQWIEECWKHFQEYISEAINRM